MVMSILYSCSVFLMFFLYERLIEVCCYLMLVFV